MQSRLSAIMTPEYFRLLTLQLEVMYGSRTMLALVKPLPYEGIYQPLPEDDEVGQEMLQHLLAERGERLLDQSPEQGPVLRAQARSAASENTPLVSSSSV